MTPIEISERVIAVEVPKDTVKCIVSNVYTPSLRAIDENDFYIYINLPKLPIGFKYKYIWLWSSPESLSHLDIAECFDAGCALGESKEYALITREKY